MLMTFHSAVLPQQWQDIFIAKSHHWFLRWTLQCSGSGLQPKQICLPWPNTEQAKLDVLVWIWVCCEEYCQPTQCASSPKRTLYVPRQRHQKVTCASPTHALLQECISASQALYHNVNCSGFGATQFLPSEDWQVWFCPFSYLQAEHLLWYVCGPYFLKRDKNVVIFSHVKSKYLCMGIWHHIFTVSLSNSSGFLSFWRVPSLLAVIYCYLNCIKSLYNHKLFLNAVFVLAPGKAVMLYIWNSLRFLFLPWPKFTQTLLMRRGSKRPEAWTLALKALWHALGYPAWPLPALTEFL